MKKIKFKHENEVPDKIIGISSLHKDFQIAWSINNSLNIEMSKAEDISIQIKKEEISEIFNFSIFSFDDLDENYFLLISNKDKGKNLSSKYKNIDYFFVIKSNFYELQSSFSEINNSDFVIGSFIIKTDNVLKKVINRIIEK